MGPLTYNIAPVSVPVSAIPHYNLYVVPVQQQYPALYPTVLPGMRTAKRRYYSLYVVTCLHHSTALMRYCQPGRVERYWLGQSPAITSKKLRGPSLKGKAGDILQYKMAL